MQITNSIKICGINYAIEEQEYLIDGNDLLHGTIEYDNARIIISTRNNRNEQLKLITFMHEIMHAMARHFGDHETNDNEAIIDMFAKGMYQVIIENPAIFDSGKAGRNSTVQGLIKED